MNRKTIKKILNKKFDDFCESITDEDVKHLIMQNSIITGGSIVSMLLSEKINDFDIYFTDRETVEAVANYYVNLWNEQNPQASYKPKISTDDDRIFIFTRSDGIAVSDDDPFTWENENDIEAALNTTGEPENEKEDRAPYTPVFLSENAITLTDKIQLVIRFYGDPEEIHKNYDFVHCTNYWVSTTDDLVLQPRALESILAKELIYQGSLYPVCSLIRTRKFIQRGWYINAGQYLKMCFQVSALNLLDIDVLKDQLTGVDALYFFQVIDYCKERMENDTEFTLTVPYLCEIIDRIFS